MGGEKTAPSARTPISQRPRESRLRASLSTVEPSSAISRGMRTRTSKYLLLTVRISTTSRPLPSGAVPRPKPVMLRTAYDAEKPHPPTIRGSGWDGSFE